MLRHWAANAALLAALERRPRAALMLVAWADAATAALAPGTDRENGLQRAETLARAALGLDSVDC
jgi:hypothetical protein